jgi:hypothetical protein
MRPAGAGGTQEFEGRKNGTLKRMARDREGPPPLFGSVAPT